MIGAFQVACTMRFGYVFRTAEASGVTFDATNQWQVHRSRSSAQNENLFLGVACIVKRKSSLWFQFSLSAGRLRSGL